MTDETSARKRGAPNLGNTPADRQRIAEAAFRANALGAVMVMKDSFPLDVVVDGMRRLMPDQLRLSLDNIAVLCAIAQSTAGCTSIKDVVAVTGLQKVNATRQVTRLIELGLISKSRFDGDQRLIDIRIEPAGQHIYNGLNEWVRRCCAQNEQPAPLGAAQ